MKIAIDLDGTISPTKEPDQRYDDLQPLPGASERIRQLRSAGHYIIILTARNMSTCEGNVGKVVKNVGKLTLDWLEKFNIEYDEIHFGKPNAEVYIDDRALRFSSWQEISEDLLLREARAR